METKPKNKIDNELDENQTKEDIKIKALEKVRQKATIINIEEIALAEALKGADAYMTEDKASGLKKWWKHTVAEGFYRGREVTRVKKEIKETGNIYTRRIGDNPTKPAHESAMKAISDRFRADYEDSLVLSKGEERKFLDDNDQEVIKVKNDLKNLLDNYAMGNLDDEAFNNSKKGIINSLKKKEDLFKGADNYADNLFEIAQNAKIAYEHGAKLGELDYDLGMIVGKAKSSLKTEAHFNWVDKGIDKMKKSKVGRFISPTVLSTGVGIAYSVIVGMDALANTPVGKIVSGIGSLGISVAVSTAFAAANESQRVADERKQHGLEMAEGGEYKAGSKRREQMAKYEYGMEKSTDLSQRLRDLMFEKDKDGNDIVKDIKEEDVKDIIACLGNIDARKSLNAEKKIDLISYSNIGNVEKESTDLTILTAQAKFELEKRVKTDLKNGLPQGINSYEEYLESVTNTVKDSLLGGEKGINNQDKSYRWYKAGRVAKKAAITATVGIIAGATIRELMTIGSDHVQGLFNNPDGTTTVTPARHLWDIMTGNQTHMDMGNSTVFDIGNHNYEFPEGISGVENGNAIDVVKGGQVIYSFIPKYDANGLLDPTLAAKLAHDGILSSGINNVINSTQEVTGNAHNWIQNHPGETIQVHHNHVGPFMDNNTPSIPDPVNPGHMIGADGNELGMRWGGINGTGVNGNGDAVLNISHMNATESFHGDVSIDVPEEMKNGNLMAIIYLNGGGTGIPVDVQPNGEIIFDHNNPIMQQVFTQDANGHMVNHAKVIELVQKLGIDKNGVLNVSGISAIVGEGLNNIKDIVPCYDDIAVNTLIPPADVQSMLFVPTVSRKPLEPVTFGGEDKKPQEEGIKPVVTEINPNKKEPTVEKDGGGDMVFGPAGPWSAGEKGKNKAIEISQEEYDGMKDDLKMLNRKIKSSEGIITLSVSDFKSEYGKKRYMDLKSIQESRSKGFNKTENELQKIGDEMEKILMSAKIVSKEDMAKQLEKEKKAKSLESDLKSDLEMLNKNIRESKGIITLDESSFKSDFGKEKYRNLKSIQDSRSKGFNKTENELQKIGDEMEKYLSNYQQAINSKKEGEPEVKKESEKIEVTKKETTPNIQKDKVIESTTPENNSRKTEVKSIFTKEDLSKIGTKFKNGEDSFEVVKITNNRWFDVFSSTRVEVIRTDKKGKETLISYKKKELESELKKGKIKIIKIDKGDISLNNKKAEEEKVDEDLEKFMNQVSLLVSNAIEEHLSGDNDIELKKSAQKSYPFVIENFKKEFESLNENEEKEMLKELALICKDKKKFIDAIVSFQKRENK